MKFIYTNGCNEDFILLCHELDSFLNKVAGGEENRLQYIPYNNLSDIHDVVIAYDNGIAVGCAGFKHYDDSIAEIKRVFVKEEYRGQGISKQIMKLIEIKAKEKGYLKLILESGDLLTAAMNFYHSTGYATIPNYGQYKSMLDSICMEKSL